MSVSPFSYVKKLSGIQQDVNFIEVLTIALCCCIDITIIH